MHVALEFAPRGGAERGGDPDLGLGEAGAASPPCQGYDPLENLPRLELPGRKTVPDVGGVSWDSRDSDQLLFSNRKEAFKFKKLFSVDNVELEVGDDALTAIAQIAHEDTTGARGLRSVIEKSLLKLQFTLPKLADNGLEKVIITEDFILGNTDNPILAYAETEQSVNE